MDGCELHNAQFVESFLYFSLSGFSTTSKLPRYPFHLSLSLSLCVCVCVSFQQRLVRNSPSKMSTFLAALKTKRPLRTLDRHITEAGLHIPVQAVLVELDSPEVYQGSQISPRKLQYHQAAASVAHPSDHDILTVDDLRNLCDPSDRKIPKI